MTSQQTLTAFEAIRQRLRDADQSEPDWNRPAMDIYAMTEAHFTLQPRRVNSTEAETAMCEFKPDQGWVCRQSKVSVFHSNADYRSTERGGILLSAELASKDQQSSLHLRQDGRGSWILTVITDISDQGSAHPQAIEGLAHTTCLIGSAAVQGWLKYRVYWTHDDVQGWRTSASRLLGIDQDSEHRNNPCKQED